LGAVALRAPKCQKLKMVGRPVWCWTPRTAAIWTAGVEGVKAYTLVWVAANCGMYNFGQFILSSLAFCYCFYHALNAVMVMHLVCMCLSVCLYCWCFTSKPYPRKFIFGVQLRLRNALIKFVCQAHGLWVKVK